MTAPLAGVTVLDAMAHPAMFGPHFRGDTWRAWRAFLGAMFALPMDDADLALYQHHTGRTAPPAAPFREAALKVGRRGGKSRTLALIAVFLATFRDYGSHLAAGEVGTLPIIAADRRQARTILRYVVGMLRAVPALAALIEAETNESVTLSCGVVIEIHTASFRVTRGYTLIAALCDEVAFWRSEDSANPDVEIIGALRPGLASMPGAVLLIASSPYSRRGVLWNTFRRHWAQDASAVLAWSGTTAEMNPSIDPAIIAQAYDDDPAAAAAEYGAEFRSDIAAFIDRAAVDACIVPGRFELPPLSGITYRAHVDPSGGSADSFTLAIAHQKDGIRVLDAVREVRPPFSPEAVVSDFAAVLKTYRVTKVTGDRYAGEFPRELFRKQGITYELSELPASDIYRDALPLLNSGRVELLDLPRMVAQLCALERRTARSGKDSISHPPGGHDDAINSVCGALLLTATAPALRFTAADLENIRNPNYQPRGGDGANVPMFFGVGDDG